ncbi:MAG TPA: hydroxymethylbilane synthase [Desulfobacteraceae bacterium]|nr:hydroxymethylbilane synthase [Deltaproteobacteria bacterium]RLB96860.1 MAG: hydroxymethylbilane synthase [Deltaproteobacteria bacterium]HDI60847.1 hydroxymethylbilane synthase [Desulfobacteraceae bacterium]
MMGLKLTIGTRGSKLALWQAQWVGDQIRRLYPDCTVELVVIKTRGDKILDVSLAEVGGKGLFVKEIEEALLDGRLDLAVHSMKDMPAELPEGLCIGPVPEREDPADVLISRDGLILDDLPAGARVGTASLRRAAQLKHHRPDLTIVSLRGNLDTRLRKLADPAERLDAIVLAAAGVRRLGLADRITQRLPTDIVLPAVAQGALCIELRRDDPFTAAMVAPLDHLPSRIAVRAERAFLHRLKGGCQVPIGAHANVDDGHVSISGLVAELDGAEMVRETLTGPVNAAGAVGKALAERLLAAGADRILEEIAAHES